MVSDKSAPAQSPLRWFTGFGLGVTILLLTGCGKAWDEADLTFLNGTDPETIDPALITGQPEFRVTQCLFEGLLRGDKAGEVEAGMADMPEISEDGLEWTFRIRPEAVWSNGDPVTAHDFVWSWKRVLNPETQAAYASQLFFIRNAEAYLRGEITDFSQVGAEAIDDRTLKVTLKGPTPFFAQLAAFPTLYPVHRETVEAHPEDWIKPEYIVTNGAYLLEEWRLYDRIRLRKNPNYWDAENVALETVDVLAMEEPTNMINVFHSGQADLSLDKSSIPPNLIEPLSKQPYFHSSPFLGNYFVRFNCTRPPFNDPRVRRAFSLAIDRERIVRNITKLGEEPAYSFTPPGAGGYDPPERRYYDPEKARELMTEAGYPDGRGFPQIKYLYNNKEIDTAVAVELSAMLEKELNVVISLQKQEWKVYLNSMTELEYDLCRSSWVADYDDPNTFLAMFISGDGNNRTGFSNRRYDELIAEANATVDQERRFEIFREAETLLVEEEAVIAPIYYYVGVQLYHADKLGGIQGNRLDDHPIREMYWK